MVIIDAAIPAAIAITIERGQDRVATQAVKREPQIVHEHGKPSSSSGAPADAASVPRPTPGTAFSGLK